MRVNGHRFSQGACGGPLASIFGCDDGREEPGQRARACGAKTARFVRSQGAQRTQRPRLRYLGVNHPPRTKPTHFLEGCGRATRGPSAHLISQGGGGLSPRTSLPASSRAKSGLRLRQVRWRPGPLPSRSRGFPVPPRRVGPRWGSHAPSPFCRLSLRAAHRARLLVLLCVGDRPPPPIHENGRSLTLPAMCPAPPGERPLRRSVFASPPIFVALEEFWIQVIDICNTGFQKSRISRPGEGRSELRLAAPRRRDHFSSKSTEGPTWATTAAAAT